MYLKNARIAAFAALLVGVATAATGCGSDDEKASGSDKPANVAYLTYANADYQQAQEAGMKAGVKPSGGTIKLFNSNFDPTVQQKQCTDAVSSGRYNVIVLTPITPPTGVPCAKAAKAAGIPVVQFEAVVGKDVNDIKPQADGVEGSVAISPDSAAPFTAELAKQACAEKNPCNVILDSVPGEVFGEAVTKAVTGIDGVKIVQKINSNFDPSQIQKVVPDALSAHPDVDVVLFMSDSQALAAVPVIKAAGMSDTVKVIGGGGSRAGAAAVTDGSLFGTVGAWPFQTGKAAGEMAVKAANGEKIDPIAIDGQVIDSPQVVTRDTVDEFKPEWGASAG
jgi:ribose transport system substrate-binding protein